MNRIALFCIFSGLKQMIYDTHSCTTSFFSFNLVFVRFIHVGGCSSSSFIFHFCLLIHNMNIMQFICSAVAHLVSNLSQLHIYWL